MLRSSGGAKPSQAEEGFSLLYVSTVVPVEVSLNGLEISASGVLGDYIAVKSETCVCERYLCRDE
jgi:hypothetical protein